jgi:hypothetical protein
MSWGGWGTPQPWGTNWAYGSMPVTPQYPQFGPPAGPVPTLPVEAERKRDRSRSPPRTRSPNRQGELRNRDLPKDFQPDGLNLDSTSVHDFSLPRKVKSTRWSREKGISDMPVHEVPLVSLLWQGLKTWDLRLMAHGRYVNLIVARNTAESMLAESVIWEARKLKSEGKDLAKLVEQFAESESLSFTEGNDRKKAYERLATQLFAPLVQSPQGYVSLINENKVLKEQLKALELRGTPEAKGREGLYRYLSPKPSGLPVESPGDKSSIEMDVPLQGSVPAQLLEKPQVPVPAQLPQKQEDTCEPPQKVGFPRFLRGGKVAILEKEAPSSTKPAAITKWLKSNPGKLPAKKMRLLDALVPEIFAAYEEIDSPSRPQLSRVLTDWGLDPALAVSATEGKEGKKQAVWQLLGVAYLLTD